MVSSALLLRLNSLMTEMAARESFAFSSPQIFKRCEKEALLLTRSCLLLLARQAAV